MNKIILNFFKILQKICHRFGGGFLPSGYATGANIVTDPPRAQPIPVRVFSRNPNFMKLGKPDKTNKNKWERLGAYNGRVYSGGCRSCHSEGITGPCPALLNAGFRCDWLV